MIDLSTNLALSFGTAFLILLVDRLTRERSLIVPVTAGSLIFVILLTISAVFEESKITIQSQIADIIYNETEFYQVNGNFKRKGNANIYLLARKQSNMVGSDMWPEVWTVIALVENIDYSTQIWSGRMNLRRIDGKVTADDRIEIIAVIATKAFSISSRIKPEKLIDSNKYVISNLISIRIARVEYT